MNQNNKNQNKKVQSKIKLDTTSKVILGVLLGGLVGLVGFVLYRGYTSMQNITEQATEQKQEQKAFEEVIENKQYKAPDYSALEATPSAEDAPTEKVEGTIGYDAYYELSKKEISESLAKNKAILGETLYNEMLNGMDTDYFSKSIEYNYNDMINEMKELFEEAWVSSALYDKYVKDGIEVPDYHNIECQKEDCQLKKYITNYTRGEAFDYLMEAHNKWEANKVAEAQRNSADDSYMNLFYQNEICNNYDYLEDVDVDVILLNAETAAYGMESLQEAYDEGLLEVKRLNYKENPEAVKKFSLYKDIDYYDDNIKELANDTIQATFGSDLTSNSYYLGNYDSLEDNSSQENLNNAINDMKEYQGDNGGIDYNKLEYWHAETISLTNRNPDDVIYILWKIVPGSCKHVENIPSLDDLYEELYPKAKMYIADSLVADAIYAELNNLDEETVHNLLRDKYGITIPYGLDDNGDTLLETDGDESRPHYHAEDGSIVYLDEEGSTSESTETTEQAHEDGDEDEDRSHQHAEDGSIVQSDEDAEHMEGN